MADKRINDVTGYTGLEKVSPGWSERVVTRYMNIRLTDS